jgi:hypothetical protein
MPSGPANRQVSRQTVVALSTAALLLFGVPQLQLFASAPRFGAKTSQPIAVRCGVYLAYGS